MLPSAAHMCELGTNTEHSKPLGVPALPSHILEFNLSFSQEPSPRKHPVSCSSAPAMQHNSGTMQSYQLVKSHLKAKQTKTIHEEPVLPVQKG